MQVPTATVMMDPRINMTKTSRHWVSLQGAREVNQISSPQTGGASNSTTSFNVNVPNSVNVVLDRSSVQIAVPVTITMAGNAIAGADLYNPLYDCFRSFPLLRLMKLLKLNCASNQLTYEPYNLIDAMECFSETSNNKEYMATMIDMACNYTQYLGMNVSPFAQRFESDRISRTASVPITVANNTFNAATLTATLITSLDMFPPFDGDENFHGAIFDPLKIDISYIDNPAMVWSRSPSHPQNTLNSLTVTIGSGTLYATFLTLPSFVPTPPTTILYPYYETQVITTKTTANILAGASFAFDTGVQQLSYTPSRVYIYGTVSNTERYTSVTTMTQIPNQFTEILNIQVQYNNSPIMYSSATQADLFGMSKANGLIKDYTYSDFIGEVGGNAVGQPLRGSIVCFQPDKNFGSTTSNNITGFANKQTLQIKGTMKNQSADVHSYDIIIVIIQEGIMSVNGGTNGTNTLAVDLKNTQLSTDNFNDVMPYLEGSGNAKKFFKGLWSKVNPVLKQSGVLGNLANLIPVVGPYVSPMVKTLGYGEGEGTGEGGMLTTGGRMYSAGMPATGGMLADGGMPAGKQYLKRAAVKRPPMYKRV